MFARATTKAERFHRHAESSPTEPAGKGRDRQTDRGTENTNLSS